MMIVLISAWILLETIRLIDHDAISELHGRKNESLSGSVVLLRQYGRAAGLIFPNPVRACTLTVVVKRCVSFGIIQLYSFIRIL